MLELLNIVMPVLVLWSSTMGIALIIILLLESTPAFAKRGNKHKIGKREREKGSIAKIVQKLVVIYTTVQSCYLRFVTHVGNKGPPSLFLFSISTKGKIIVQ